MKLISIAYIAYRAYSEVPYNSDYFPIVINAKHSYVLPKQPIFLLDKTDWTNYSKLAQGTLTVKL